MKAANRCIRFLALTATIILSTAYTYAQEIKWTKNHVSAWRGERIGMQAEIANCTEGTTLTLSVFSDWADTEIGWLRYVITDDFKTCGTHPDSITPYLVADRISHDLMTTVGKDIDKSSHFWLTAEVPRTATPGIHKIEVGIKDKTGNVIGTSEVSIEVKDSILPLPHDYRFHLDLWQQPYAVSRYYNVEPWSQQHIDLLRPYMKMLARAGQKVVSAILFYEPWGEQSNDKFEPMVQTTLTTEGKWTYDYTIFDQWVTLMDECGINHQIDCFSMIPWDMSFRYWDEKTSSYAYLKTKTSATEYKQLWTDFLKNFAVHLREKGWFEKTCIAMDERSLNDMLNAYEIAQQAVPGMKMALAGNYHQRLVDILQDYSVAYGQHLTKEELDKRRSNGQTTTFYTCCSNPTPNLFTNSAPDEAAYIPIYCYENNFDGYLHWSWINWTDNPVTDSRFKFFPPGDTYFIYPDGCSSVRFERLIEGIQQYEKLILLSPNQH